MISISDEEIIYALKRGSNEALEFIFTKYSKFVRLWSHDFDLPKYLKEEGFQYCCYLFFKCIDLYDISFGTFASYFKSSCYNHFKRLVSDYNFRLNNILLKTNDQLDYIVIDELMCDNIFDSINIKLSKNEKELLLLRDEGYSYLEIAQKMNISCKKVGNIIQGIKNKAKCRN